MQGIGKVFLPQRFVVHIQDQQGHARSVGLPQIFEREVDLAAPLPVNTAQQQPETRACLSIVRRVIGFKGRTSLHAKYFYYRGCQQKKRARGVNRPA